MRGSITVASNLEMLDYRRQFYTRFAAPSDAASLSVASRQLSPHNKIWACPTVLTEPKARPDMVCARRT